MANEVLIVASMAPTKNKVIDTLKIKKSLENFTIKSSIINISENLYENLEKDQPKIVFNMIPLIGDKFSWFVPALCDNYTIPFTGAGMFTISTLTGGFSEEILAYHNIKQSKPSKKNLYHVSMLGNKKELIFHVLDYDKKGKLSKTCSLDTKMIKNIILMAVNVKNSLKIHDYFSIDVSIESERNNKFSVSGIEPSPSLNEKSNFCMSLKALGLSYEEIMAGILIYAMVRNNIPLSDKLKQLQGKLLKIS